MKTDYPKCRTCRHWKSPVNNMRLCEKVASLIMAGPLSRVMAIEPTDGILTHASFGCVLHQPVKGGTSE